MHAPTYIIKIRANPGIVGEDPQGNYWTTFTYVGGGRTIPCSVCGKQIDGGYVRYVNREPDLHVCCSHVMTQYGAMSNLVATLTQRICQMGGSSILRAFEEE